MESVRSLSMIAWTKRHAEENQMNNEPVQVLIAGGGVAALEATLALRALAADRVEIELVAPEREFTYRPLSVAEPFRVAEMRRFPLERLVHAAGARLREGSLASASTGQHVAHTTNFVV